MTPQYFMVWFNRFWLGATVAVFTYDINLAYTMAYVYFVLILYTYGRFENGYYRLTVKDGDAFAFLIIGIGLFLSIVYKIVSSVL